MMVTADVKNFNFVNFNVFFLIQPDYFKQSSLVLRMCNSIWRLPSGD